MLNHNQLPLGAIVSFQLHPRHVLGTGYSRAKVLGVLDHRTASQYIDVPATHANVFPSLPAGTPNDYRSYWYVKLLLSSGIETCIGIPWIIDSSLIIHENSSLQITLRDVGPQEQEELIRLITARGFTIADVKVLDSAGMPSNQ